MQGLDVWGAGGGSRHGASPRFTALECEARHERHIGMWAGGAVAVTGTFRGRTVLGSTALLSGAECYYGGRQFGAGFDSGTLSGEQCAMAALGLRWTTTGPLGPRTQARLSLYGSLDAGWVRQNGALEAGERRSASAGSSSIGAALVLSRGTSVEVQAAWPLSYPDDVPDPGVRVNVMLARRF